MTGGKERMICLGAFAGAHGVKGEAKVKTFTAAEADVAAYGPLSAEDGKRRFLLTIVRALKPGLVLVRAPEIKSREDAQALAGTRLYVPRTALPALVDEDEFYLEDLVGLDVVDETGAPRGRVAAIHNFGAGDIVEVKARPGGAKPVLIAFTKAAVPGVDLAAGRLTITAAALAESDAPGDAERPADHPDPSLSDETGRIVSANVAVDLDAMREEDA